ncbi:MAG: RNA polymerase sigma factor [Bacteroidota bacterium]|nr:RNA polymerase sigma factor [Bacteroidota bacterium]
MTTTQFNRSVDSYSDNLYRFLLKNIRNEEKAKDLVQDSYEKLWVNKDKVHPEKVKSYLFTLGYRTMIDRIRHEKKIAPMPDENMPEECYKDEYSGIQEHLHAAVNRLPQDQKAVVMLRDYEGWSYKEIASITEMSEAQVKVYIYRARVFLKKYIGKIQTLI